MAINPTKLTLSWLRKQGAFVEETEHTIPYTKIKRDLFGCIDMIALQCGEIVGIQVTSHGNHAARRRKILANPIMQAWIGCGGILQIISWKPNESEPSRIETITPKDFAKRC